ncbi:glycosyl hydrolase 115 family protein [Lederbergia graminis]|uniref:Glycosyl hydrolase 115 family protein n=1 Tax=Lederbergia graminis TaxID=735518 RepID=A0ABW0LKA2_9BACI
MNFNVAKQDYVADLYLEETALSGVVKIAEKVAADIELVSGKRPRIKRELSDASRTVIAVLTVGHSELAKSLPQAKEIEGKREVFSIFFAKDLVPGSDNTLVILGSDKRGTIYGLFTLSEKIGVSPLLYWGDSKPIKKEEISLGQDFVQVSKEPSVKYRGFFINDEWPAFGNWTMKSFGGFNANMYDHVFELLLRLKGNYLWPAMWSSSFSLDGPGLLSAELADEYGVIIGSSHHEPCCRAGEEFKHFKGEDSIYGNEWSFINNKEGITKFWEDGLKRNGKFENLITIGMRGEADSLLLRHDSSLEENINVLRDIITTQHNLMREIINPDITKIPRVFVIYKEVEKFFYGNEHTEGLIDWEELDGVTLMLADDNFQNVRTLPREDLRDRDGGWGMYYHFDYHGAPTSYEWVNSTHLSKVWEQMTMAWEFGVREAWIVNVGDIKPQELPLSYFMALAYDFEKWGTTAPNKCDEFLEDWVAQQFPALGKLEQSEIFYVLDKYTYLNSIRRPEVVKPEVYSIEHYREAERILELVAEIESKCEKLRAIMPSENLDSFIGLVYFPAVASANLIKMSIYAAYSQYFAKLSLPIANTFADKVEAGIKRDNELTDEYHTIADGKWYGMGLSKHFCFESWNDEGWHYPEVARVDIEVPRKTFVETEGYIAINAHNFAESTTFSDDKWIVLENFGKTGTGVKAYPFTKSFAAEEDAPTLTYNIYVTESGEYEVECYTSPSNPVYAGGKLRYAISANDNPFQVVNSVSEDFVGGDYYNRPWSIGVTDNIHKSKNKVNLNKGLNKITYKAVDPAVVLERIIIYRTNNPVKPSYLGPEESLYTN